MERSIYKENVILPIFRLSLGTQHTFRADMH